MTLLETHNLTVSIGDCLVCRDAALHIEAGQCWGLLGRNGSGKTTLLRALAGLHRPDGGAVELLGQPLRMLSRRVIAQRLGLLLQDEALPFPVTVEAAVLAGRHAHLPPFGWERAEDRRLAHEALEAVGMAPFAHRLTSSLSGGERRRVAIATLLAQAPAVMLLDEPTNHLDLDQQIRILRLLHQRMGRMRALVMSLHDINMALRFCDRLILLDDEGLHTGPAAQLGTAERLSTLYGHPLTVLEGPTGPVLIPQ